MFRTMRHPLEQLVFCVMAKLKCAIDRIVRIFILAIGEVFWKCKEAWAEDLKPVTLISSWTESNEINVERPNMVG